MTKRRGKRPPPAPEREAAAKRAAADALMKLRPGTTPVLRAHPVVLRNSKTKKWTRWEEIDPADRTPEALIPVVDEVAKAMTAVEMGKNRNDPRDDAHNSNAATYAALQVHFSGANKANLLVPPINAARAAQIESEVLRFNPKWNSESKKFAKFMGAYLKHLRGRK